MAKLPRKPRPIARSADVLDLAVASRAVVPKPADPRQPDLFARPFIPPMLATLADKAPVGTRWQYEIKHDGYRVQAHVSAGQARLYTRRGFDWTDRMPFIAVAVSALRCQSAILDGEAVIEDEAGVSDFFALHGALRAGSAPAAILYAFDLLELDGEDLRPMPLVERRATLAVLLTGAADGIEISPQWEDAPHVEHVCGLGLEGLVAKRKDAPYRSGRSDCWQKVKCTTTEPFAVVGYDPAGKRGVAALRIATLQENTLVACGSVGSGFSAQASSDLRLALDAGRHVVAEVEHRGRTPSGELRHPVFKGWHSEV